jgi:hypothetical protein
MYMFKMPLPEEAKFLLQWLRSELHRSLCFGIMRDNTVLDIDAIYNLKLKKT